MYKLFFHKRSLKQLKKLPKHEQKKILKKIKKLQENPTDFSLNIKPLHNTQNSWRVRADNLRAIYTFDRKQKIIYIEYLGYRGSIYKRIKL